MKALLFCISVGVATAVSAQELNKHKLPIVQSDLSYVESVDVKVDAIELNKSQLSCYEMWTNENGEKVLVKASLTPALTEAEEIDGRKLEHEGETLTAKGNERQLYYFLDQSLYLIEITSWDPVENAVFKRDYIYFDNGNIIMYDQYKESVDYWASNDDNHPKASVTERAYYFEGGTPVNLPDTEIDMDIMALENISYLGNVRRVEP